MLWVLYSLLSAFGWATADAFTKRVPKADDYILMLARFLYASPLALLLLFFIQIPKLESGFWLVLSIAIPVEALAWVLYIKAIRSSPLSLVAPLISLTPFFLVLTSFVILNELPSAIGFFGIFLVVIGTYILNLKGIRNGIFEPFRDILKERGCIYMLIVAFLFSITATLSKMLVQKSSPLFFSAIYFPLLAILFLAITMFTSKGKISQLKTNFNNLFFSGLFFGLMIVFHALAVMLVIVPYMISIKRTSSIFSVLYGHFWLKEENIKGRLIGALIMLAGAALIILA